MKAITPIIITGMHRSNTSLVAKAFQNAGLFLGETLLPPSKHNKEGYFEEQHIIKLHNKWLKNRNYNFWDVTKFDSSFKQFLPGEKQEAQKLLNEVFGKRKEYGFKDPRATLFAFLWKEILPNTKFVFIFRHPALVVKSLIKRKDFKSQNPLKILQAIHAIKVWTAYNNIALSFQKTYPSDTELIHAPDDFNKKTENHINNKITNQWNIALKNKISFTNAINPNLLNKKISKKYQVLINFFPSSLELYNKLTELAKQTKK